MMRDLVMWTLFNLSDTQWIPDDEPIMPSQSRNVKVCVADHASVALRSLTCFGVHSAGFEHFSFALASGVQTLRHVDIPILDEDTLNASLHLSLGPEPTICDSNDLMQRSRDSRDGIGLRSN